MNNTKQIYELFDMIKACKKKPKKIFLQLPEGLKTKAIEIIDALHDYDVILSGDTCYGACDLRINEAVQAGCDLIVHIGHSQFPKKKIESKIPVIYYPWKFDVQLDEKTRQKLLDCFTKIPEWRIGLVTSIQHLDLMPEISELLNKLNKKTVIVGYVLGCWTDNVEKNEDKVDAFLFIGTGRFHVSGIKTERPLYFFDLENMTLTDMSEEIFKQEKIKLAKIANVMEAKSFAILVSSKPGQLNINDIEKIRKIIEKQGKKSYIILLDEINNTKLLGIKVDAFINLACPRISEDRFDKPIVNAVDFLTIFGDKNNERKILKH